MVSVSRWFVPAVLAAGLGFGVLAIPAPVQAQDPLIRVLVDLPDVVIRGGYPYYRHGRYGYDDRLIVQRDRYGRPVYYRMAPRHVVYRSGPPYGNAYGHYRNDRNVRCNPNGKCKVEYYDPRYDRRDDYVRYDDRYDARYVRYDRDDRYWDGRRWRDRDDD